VLFRLAMRYFLAFATLVSAVSAAPQEDEITQLPGWYSPLPSKW
jgi:hypothetical protein